MFCLDTSQVAKYASSVRRLRTSSPKSKATSQNAKCSNIVHVISKSAWRQAVVQDHSLEGPISEWHKVASLAEWQNLVDVKQVYPSADYVDPYTVFNIRGGNYRLIVKIEYRWQMIFVKHLLTHADYQKGGWKT
jgi:mRNA interferase HigB